MVMRKGCLIALIAAVAVLSEWDAFIRALIYVESRGNTEAVSKCNAVGILQITPIYVKEVNRILKEERYTLEDRTDPEKSLEMFGVMQDYHNPEHDIDRAIKMHNPGAGEKYSKAIKERMRHELETDLADR